MVEALLLAIFFFQCKLSRKAAKTPSIINLAFREGTTTGRIVEFWFMTFLSGDKSFNCSESSAVVEILLKSLIEADPPTTAYRLASDQEQTYRGVSTEIPPVEKTKKLDKWVPGIASEDPKKRSVKLFLSLILRYKNYFFWKDSDELSRVDSSRQPRTIS